MKPVLFFVLALACSTSALLAFPASVATGVPESEIPWLAKPAFRACATLATTVAEPVLLSGCFIQVECSDSSIVSCSGNSTCSTGGASNRCVICDGVNRGCCAETCCEVCVEALDTCLDDCSTPAMCNACWFTYNNLCVPNCTGGCD